MARSGHGTENWSDAGLAEQARQAEERRQDSQALMHAERFLQSSGSAAPTLDDTVFTAQHALAADLP
eukprot:SAG22_NODE_14626_length_369_cov_1.122222_2_plen_66_part_01